MKGGKFEPSDFTFGDGDFSHNVAKQANALMERWAEREHALVQENVALHALVEKYERMLKDAPIIQGRMVGEAFYQLCGHSVIYEHSITHTAQLVDVKEIKK